MDTRIRCFEILYGKKTGSMRIFLLILLAFLQGVFTEYFIQNPEFYQLNSDIWQSEEFRAMRLGSYTAGLQSLDSEKIAGWMLSSEFDLTEMKKEPDFPGMVRVRRPEDFGRLVRVYDAIFRDLIYFPIPKSTNPQTPDIVYEDSWMQDRTYGGHRGHEGCDLMGTQLPRGSYPVVSITDGTVEKIGWLEKGGWRIGIRSESGLYLYYAHLYSYSRAFQEGETVKAGELLGFLGDSGYSAIEGTTGQFEPHLHLGLYLNDEQGEEFSVNPYWILRYLEKFRLRYSY